MVRNIYLENVLLESVQNCTLKNNRCFQITLDSSSANDILNNTLTNYSWSGITLDSDSSNNQISGNDVSGKRSGIVIYSDNNLISFNNRFNNSQHGIFVFGYGSNDIINNSCHGNQQAGISLTTWGDITEPLILLENNRCYNNRLGIQTGGGVEILQCEIYGNTDSGILLNQSVPELYVHGCRIYDNELYGIMCYMEQEGLNATNNYWGSNSGPYHPVNNTNGKGDNVSDYVIFDPWIGKGEEPPPKPLTTAYAHAAAPDDGNGTKERPFNKIQDAINASGAGATIYVWEGVYYENVVVDKTVSLIGNGSETTTIDGGESSVVVRITADWVNMSGFSVTGSGPSRFNDLGIILTWFNGSGIVVESDNNHIFKNTCDNKSNGIFLSYSSNCSITDNKCSNNSGGIDFYTSSACTISNNTCENNTTVYRSEAPMTAQSRTTHARTTTTASNSLTPAPANSRATHAQRTTSLASASSPPAIAQ